MVSALTAAAEGPGFVGRIFRKGLRRLPGSKCIPDSLPLYLLKVVRKRSVTPPQLHRCRYKLATPLTALEAVTSSTWPLAKEHDPLSYHSHWFIMLQDWIK